MKKSKISEESMKIHSQREWKLQVIQGEVESPASCDFNLFHFNGVVSKRIFKSLNILFSKH